MKTHGRVKRSSIGVPPIPGGWKATLVVAFAILMMGLAVSFGAAQSTTANILSLVMFGVALVLTALAAVQHKATPKKDPRRR